MANIVENSRTIRWKIPESLNRCLEQRYLPCCELYMGEKFNWDAPIVYFGDFNYWNYFYPTRYKKTNGSKAQRRKIKGVLKWLTWTLYFLVFLYIPFFISLVEYMVKYLHQIKCWWTDPRRKIKTCPQERAHSFQKKNSVSKTWGNIHLAGNDAITHTAQPQNT